MLNDNSENNNCLLRLVPFAIWSSKLKSLDDLYEAVRLYCNFTHSHELVIEGCYIYCYAIRLLIVENYPMKETFNKILSESERRAKFTGFTTIQYWITNDFELEELPKPHYRPPDYIKTSLLWALYYLKHEYNLNDALTDIIKRGGSTSANASIVGGLLGASRGVESINQNLLKSILTVNDLI